MSGSLSNAANNLTSTAGAALSLFGAGGTPPSQRNRPIGFTLEDNGSIVASVTLGLRPEDMTRTDQMRTTVHHTLGGAFVDSFGQGLPVINVAGHTGWRGGADGNGEARWAMLRDQVWNRWASLRKQAVREGRDPSTIKLIYSDALSDFVVEVAPMTLTLRRSKSRPLLIQYQLNMTVVDQNAGQIQFLQGGDATKTPGEEGGFFTSVLQSISAVRAAIARASAWVQTNLIAPVRNFLSLANRVFTAVVGVVRSVRNLVASVLAVPVMLAQAGVSLFHTIGAVVSLPMTIRNDVMATASAFSNLLCWLLRARSTRLAYGDYTGFYGASDCSSISGGRPASIFTTTSAWESLSNPEASTLGISLSPAARTGLITLASSDPVLHPLNDNQIADALTDVQGGASIATGTAA